MKRAVLAGLAVGVSVFAALPADAAASNVMRGGCFLNTQGHPLVTGDTQVGVIGDESVTTTGDSPAVPIGATVTCSLKVNGVLVPGTTHSYSDSPVTGIQVGTDPVTYTAGPFDALSLCESVVFADNTAWDEICYALGDTIQLPPQVVIDTLQAIYDVIFGVVDPFVLEPVVCSTLVPISGNYGLVTVAPDGDVYVTDPLVDRDVQLVDCPPYRDI